MDVESKSDRYHTRTVTAQKGDTVLYSIDANKQYHLGRVHTVSDNGKFTLVVGIDRSIHTVYSRDCIFVRSGTHTQVSW